MTESNNNDISLPDYIDYKLRILSVGLNPSNISVERGFYFANPRNRFWRAFNQSNIVGSVVEPGANVHQMLLDEHNIGFTDVAKRPSRMGHELRASDFKRDAPLLRDKIETYQPKLVWFHGKVAVSKFMQYAYNNKSVWGWGFNDMPDLETQIYVSPNPSPANAAFSLEVLIDSYKMLGRH